MLQDGESENQMIYTLLFVYEINGLATQSRDVRSVYIIPSPRSISASWIHRYV